MLTARHAIQGASIDDVCIAALSQPPPRPSDVIGDSVPSWLDDLTVQCMSTDPKQRQAVLTLSSRNYRQSAETGRRSREPKSLFRLAVMAWFN